MDGTPLNRTRRQVTINRTVRKLTGSTSGKEDKLLAKDNGIVHYRWTPEEDDEYILITVRKILNIHTHKHRSTK